MLNGRWGPIGATDAARLWARHALLDWAAVTVAGSREPLAGMLADEFPTASGPCTIVAAGRRATLHDAALVNGAASHVVEQDDLLNSSVLHPATVVFPAILAMAQSGRFSGKALIAAFEDPAAQAVFDDHQLAVAQLDGRIEALDHQIKEVSQQAPNRAGVGALRCFRGIDTLTAFGLVT